MRRFESSRPSHKINRLAGDKAVKKGAGYHAATTRLDFGRAWRTRRRLGFARRRLEPDRQGAAEDRLG
jgi:hypothetical protein